MSENVLLVLITALATLSASFGGIIFSHRREKRQLYREKLETIIELLYEDHYWLDSRENFFFYADLRRNPSEFDNKEPFDRAIALVSLYFLEDFRDEMAAVNVSRTALKQWQLNQYQRRRKDQDAWLADADKISASHRELDKANRTALTKFEIKAREVMKRELERSMLGDVWSRMKGRLKGIMPRIKWW